MGFSVFFLTKPKNVREKLKTFPVGELKTPPVREKGYRLGGQNPVEDTGAFQRNLL